MRLPLRELEAGVDFERSAVPDADLAFLEWLGSTTLIRLRGRDPSRTRVVSTLLHANEPSGLSAVRRYLASSNIPATDVLFLLGAVQAALTPPVLSHRSLPGAADGNRVWTPPWDTPEGEVARVVLERIRATRPECLVDLHNNTGHNPAYGVAFRADPAEVALVSLFAERIVHTPLTLRTLVEATMADFPSVTVECGLAGAPVAAEVAWQGLLRLVETPALDLTRPARDVIALGSPVRVCVDPATSLAFGDARDPDVTLTISADIDRHNFERLDAGAPIGWIGSSERWPLEAVGGAGEECSRSLFVIDGHLVRTRREFVPIMMTTDREVARSDCLFYAVQPIELPDAAPQPWWR